MSNLDARSILEKVHDLVEKAFAAPIIQDATTQKEHSSNRELTSLSQNSANKSSDNKKRIKLKSMPLKPPDLSDNLLFPSISECENFRGSQFSKEATNDPFSNSIQITEIFQSKNASNLMNRKLEEIMCTPQKSETEPSLQNGTKSSSKKPQLISLPIKPITTEKRKSRVLELTSELTSEQTEVLNDYAKEYSVCLDSNLVLNILAEIIFLFHMLSANSNYEIKDNHFSSIAARVHFVNKVLALQFENIFQYLDSEVCLMLVEMWSHRIPKLARKQLKLLIQQRVDKTIVSDSSTYGSSCVNFDYEKDGKENYLDQRDFHAFCKQRDIFYSAKELWSSNSRENARTSGNLYLNNTPTRNSTPYDPSLSKVRQIFLINSNPTNVYNLASLFTSQYLLDSYILEKENENCPIEDVRDQNFMAIFQRNPSKFKQLSNRFSDGKNVLKDKSLLAFPKYFIENAPGTFGQHLIDHLVNELNLIESNEVNSLEETFTLMKKSRLLAQLLGHIYFLPYQSSRDFHKNKKSSFLTDSYASNQVSLRLFRRLPIDLCTKIMFSFALGKMTFSLPWIIEFLLRADSFAQHLPEIKNVLNLIARIYRFKLSPSNRPNGICIENLNFLRFYCGALLSHENFQDIEFDYSEPLNFDLPPLKTTRGSIEEFIVDLQPGLGNSFISKCFSNQFNEMKRILKESKFSNGGNICNVKHIRPILISEDSKKETSKVDKKTELELQLEANFFQLHSPSIKKTVDFVAERIASNFIKFLRNEVYPELRDALMLKGIHGDEAAKICKEEFFNNRNKSYCETRCKDALDLLIGNKNFCQGAMDICEKIAIRICREKVNDWVTKYINKDLFPDELKDSKLKSVDSKPKPSFQVLAALKRLQKKVHEGGNVDKSELLYVLNSLIVNIPSSIDPTVTLAVSWAAFNPSEFKGYIDHFIAFWNRLEHLDLKLLCPRNMMILHQSNDLDVTWSVFQYFVKRVMLESSVMESKVLEEQCLRLLREDFPSETYSRISNLLNSLRPNLQSSEETEVIDWVSWVCSFNENTD